MSDQIAQGTPSGEVVEQTTELDASPQPQYVTRDEMDQITRKAIDDALGRQVRLYGEGQTKLMSKLDALDANIKSLREAGVDISPVAEMKLRDKAYKEALTSSDTTTPQQVSPVAQQDALQAASPDRVNSMAAAILQNMGVTFEEGSPEIKMIKMNGSPFEYLESITLAASAWKKRTSEKPNPEARIPGLVGGTGQAKQDWQAEYRKEITEAQKDPISGVEKALQVRRKYRGLGHAV